MKIARLWLLFCLAGLLLGCGQKGPLVQPDAPKHKKVKASPPAAAAPAQRASGAAAPAQDATSDPSDKTHQP